MKVIGLTGGIGSGKSTVAKIFRCLHVPVIEADKVGRMMLAENDEVIQLVKQEFGEQVYTGNVPNRKLLASIVFNNDEALSALNKIIHPAVQAFTMNFIQSWKGKSPYIIKEAAILFESGSAALCDAVVNVSAPEHVRIDRVSQRDGATKAEVMSRINKQWSEAERIANANHIIINDGKLPVIPQVLLLDRKFRA